MKQELHTVISSPSYKEVTFLFKENWIEIEKLKKVLMNYVPQKHNTKINWPKLYKQRDNDKHKAHVDLEDFRNYGLHTDLHSLSKVKKLKLIKEPKLIRLNPNLSLRARKNIAMQKFRDKLKLMRKIE